MKVSTTCVICRKAVVGILTDEGTGGFYLAKTTYGRQYAVCDACHGNGDGDFDPLVLSDDPPTTLKRRRVGRVDSQWTCCPRCGCEEPCLCKQRWEHHVPGCDDDACLSVIEGGGDR